MAIHEQIEELGLMAVRPESYIYVVGLAQLRKMTEYHVSRINALIQEASEDKPEHFAVSVATRLRAGWVNAMQAETCAMLLLLRPQFDAVAQIINSEVLGSAIPEKEVNIYRVYTGLDPDDPAKERIREVIRACFGGNLTAIDNITNMLKHAPALVFHYMQLIGGTDGTTEAAIFPDYNDPSPASFTIPAKHALKPGETRHVFVFRPLDKRRVPTDLDLEYVLQLKEFVDRSLKDIGRALTRYQVEKGTIVLPPENKSKPLQA